MSERINTPFTAEHFVAFCKQMLGQPYWFGTCGYKATNSLLTSKTKQYPTHYTDSRMSRYKKDIQANAVVCDCIGGAKGYAWTGGGQAILDAIGTSKSVPSSYGSNGCPDKGANGMFSYAKSKGCAWGTIDTIPEVPGLAVTKDGHVGYYIGDGQVIEWQGFSAGCVQTQLSKRPWTHWYALPFIDYAGLEHPVVSGDGTAVEQAVAVKAFSACEAVTVTAASGGTVNMRQAPHTQARVLFKAPIGSEAEVLKQDGDWVKIKVITTQEGWMKAEFLKK